MSLHDPNSRPGFDSTRYSIELFYARRIAPRFVSFEEFNFFDLAGKDVKRVVKLGKGAVGMNMQPFYSPRTYIDQMAMFIQLGVHPDGQPFGHANVFYLFNN